MGKHRVPLGSPARDRSDEIPFEADMPSMPDLFPFDQEGSEGAPDLSLFAGDSHETASEAGMDRRPRDRWMATGTKDKEGRSSGRRHSISGRPSSMGDASTRVRGAEHTKHLRRRQSEDGSDAVRGKTHRHAPPSRSKSSTEVSINKRHPLDPRRHDRGYPKSVPTPPRNRPGLKRQMSIKQLRRNPNRHNNSNNDDQHSHTSSTKTSSSQASDDGIPESCNISLSNFVVQGSGGNSSTRDAPPVEISLQSNHSTELEPTPSDLVAKAVQACAAAAAAANAAATAIASNRNDPALASAMAAVAAAAAASASAAASVKASLDSKPKD